MVFRFFGRLPQVLVAEWRLAVLAVVLAGVARAVVAVRRARTAALAVRRGTWVEVAPPPDATRPGDAERFWLGMAGLLRGRRRGWLPHAGFELTWAGGRLSLRLWVPALVSARAVSEIAEGAWPGAVARLVNADTAGLPAVVLAGLGAHVAGGRVVVAGGRDWLPLRAGDGSDPLRGLFGFGAYLSERDAVTVQVLARPARAGRLARARAGAAGRPGTAGGTAARTVSRLALGALDAVESVTTAGGGARAGSGAAGRDGTEQALGRAAARKMADPPHWEAVIRYVAAVPCDGGDGDGWCPARARRLRDGLGARFAEFSAEMGLHGARLRHPARVLARRRLRRGFLVTTGELAGLAHLPYEPGRVPRLETAGARPVPPPPGVPLAGFGGHAGTGGHGGAQDGRDDG